MADLPAEFLDLPVPSESTTLGAKPAEFLDLPAPFEGATVGVHPAELLDDGFTDHFEAKPLDALFPAEFLDDGFTDHFESKKLGVHKGAVVQSCEDTTFVTLPADQKVRCSQAGGDRLRLTGMFPIGEPLEVFMGANGNDTDAPVYGGQGFGYLPFSTDGTTLIIVTPPQDFAGLVLLTIRVQSSGSLIVVDMGTVVERPWFGKQFDMRKSFPPQAETGARRLDLEEPL